jgi:hypothetical protein
LIKKDAQRLKLMRRREFNQASPDESSCETRSPPLASNDFIEIALGTSN